MERRESPGRGWIIVLIAKYEIIRDRNGDHPSSGQRWPLDSQQGTFIHHTHSSIAREKPHRPPVRSFTPA